MQAFALLLLIYSSTWALTYDPIQYLFDKADEEEVAGNFAETILLLEQIVGSASEQEAICNAREKLQNYYELFELSDDLKVNSRALELCAESVLSEQPLNDDEYTPNESMLLLDITASAVGKNSVYKNDVFSVDTSDSDTIDIYREQWNTNHVEIDQTYSLAVDMDYLMYGSGAEYDFGLSLSADIDQGHSDTTTGVSLMIMPRYSITYNGFEVMPSGGYEYSNSDAIYSDNYNYFFDLSFGYRYRGLGWFTPGIFVQGEYNNYQKEQGARIYSRLSFRGSKWSMSVTPGVLYHSYQKSHAKNSPWEDTDYVVDTLGSVIDTLAIYTYEGNISENIEYYPDQRTLYTTLSFRWYVSEEINLRTYGGIYVNEHLGLNLLNEQNKDTLSIDSVLETVEDSVEVNNKVHTSSHKQGYTKLFCNIYLSWIFNEHHTLTLFGKYSTTSVLEYSPEGYDDIDEEISAYVEDSYLSSISSAQSMVKLGLEYVWSY
ncbi:MAG: hypothetical protein OCD01_06325 [Fibrobacterales bacterium]